MLTILILLFVYPGLDPSVRAWSDVPRRGAVQSRSAARVSMIIRRGAAPAQLWTVRTRRDRYYIHVSACAFTNRAQRLSWKFVNRTILSSSRSFVESTILQHIASCDDVTMCGLCSDFFPTESVTMRNVAHPDFCFRSPQASPTPPFLTITPRLPESKQQERRSGAR